MTLKVITLVQDGNGTVAKAVVAETKKDWIHMQQIMQRATNLWPDAPANIKQVADIVTNGQVMQPYKDI